MVAIGKIDLEEINKILNKNNEVMLKGNRVGSDFTFLSRGRINIIFKIEPMVFYDFLTPKENAVLSVLFPMNDFLTSGTWPSIAMMDFERPSGAGREYFDYMGHVFEILKERKIKVASGHTGWYGNLGYGVAGTMALLGFKRPVFSFKRLKSRDLFYSVGNIGKELLYFSNRKNKGGNGIEPLELSIEKYIVQLIRHRKIVHYVHDISEGGLLRALQEICILGDIGFNINSSDLRRTIPRGIKYFSSSIFSASSSGAIIVSVDPSGKNEFEKIMKDNSWPFIEIEKRNKGVTLDGKKEDKNDRIADILR
jgi:hydrogenase maturation factor